MKKSVKAAMAAIMAAAVCMAGCGAQSGAGTDAATTAAAETTAVQAEQKTESTAEAAQETSDEPITLRFAWWGSDSRHEALLKAIEIYEGRYPNVTVEAEYSGYDGYYEKMMTTLSSGTAPDLFQFMKAWVPDVQNAKHYLANVETLPIDLSTLREGLLERSGSYKGEAVLIPVSVGGAAAFVNTDFAEKYDIDLSKTYTWEEIKELGKSIHEQNPDDYLMAADVDMLIYMYLEPYIVQMTGESLVDDDTYEIRFTQEQMQQAIQNIVDLYDAGAIEPFDESAAFVGQMNQNVKWINGQIGMLMDYTSAYTKYTGSVEAPIDVMKIPQMENAVCSGVSFGGDRGVSINDNSPYKEEAAKFLDFLLNDPEAIEAQGTNFGFCPTTIAEETLVGSGVVDEIQVKATSMSAENAYTTGSVGSNTALVTIREDILQEVLYGDTTVEEGAEEIYKEYESILAELKSNQ